jgi:uncharacterized protein (TIGR02996 family)
MSSWPPRVPDPYAEPISAFLDAIADAPEDVTPRLVFADWLEEHGDPRAELLRLGARVVEMRRPPLPTELVALELAAWEKKYLPAWIGTVPRKAHVHVADGLLTLRASAGFLARPSCESRSALVSGGSDTVRKGANRDAQTPDA